MSARPVPPPSDLLKLWVAAVSNARNLLAAARLLAEAGMIPPAHALATFANEEQSKAGLCFMVAMSHGQEVDSAAFWAEFKKHRPKLRRAEGFSGLLLRPPPASVRQFELAAADGMCKGGLAPCASSPLGEDRNRTGLSV